MLKRDGQPVNLGVTTAGVTGAAVEVVVVVGATVVVVVGAGASPTVMVKLRVYPHLSGGFPVTQGRLPVENRRFGRLPACLQPGSLWTRSVNL